MLIAGSIAGSVALIGISAIVSPLLGVSWSFWPVLALSMLSCVPLIFIAKTLNFGSTKLRFDANGSLVSIGLLLIPLILIAVPVMQAIGAPDHVSQTWDGLYHVSAATQIVETGNSSPFRMNLNPGADFSRYYPNVWHATVALIAESAGVTVPIATNVLTIIAAGLIWPASIFFFSAQFLRKGLVSGLIIVFTSTVFSAFPYLLLTWGVLYPNLLSTALIPIALGFLHIAIRTRRMEAGYSRVAVWIGVAGGTGAAVLAHPNAMFGLMTLATPLLIATVYDVWKSPRSREQKLIRIGSLGVTFVLFLVVWAFVSTGEARVYDASAIEAFVDFLTGTQLVSAPGLTLFVLTAIGVLLIFFSRTNRWIVVSYASVAILYAITLGITGSIRDFLTSAWYNDAARIAALAPVTAVPIVAFGFRKMFGYFQNGMLQEWTRNTRVKLWTLRTMQIVMLTLIGLTTFTSARNVALPAQLGWTGQLFAVNDASPILSPNEMKLLARLASQTSEDALIAGDPWTGTGFAFAISNRRVVFPQFADKYAPDLAKLGAGFVDSGADACAIVSDLGITHFLEFEPQPYASGKPEWVAKFSGLHDLSRSPILELVDHEGVSSLYRVRC